jgi:predicted phosphoribosyltransferase
VTEKNDFQRFLEAMKQIVSAPKTEIDRREAEYRKERKAKKDAKTS